MANYMGNEKLRRCHLTAQAMKRSRRRTGSHLLHMQTSAAARKRKGLAMLSCVDLKSRKCSFCSSQEVPMTGKYICTLPLNDLHPYFPKLRKRTYYQLSTACSSLTQTPLAFRMMSRLWKWKCWDLLLHEILHESSSKKAHWKDLEDGSMWFYSPSVAHCT